MKMTRDMRHEMMPPSPQHGEIVLYQPDETIRLEVRLENETVWLTQAQISQLFQRERSVISRHINNAFKEGECDQESNVHFLHIPNSDKPVMYYSLDVIISVGYRVKSLNGTKFRRWANDVLKRYMLKGYVADQRLFNIEQVITEHGKEIKELRKQVDFFVQSSLPPVVGVFSNGQVFSARLFVEDLIKKARREVILIDSYVDAKTFDLLDVRSTGVSATIYTERIDVSLQRLQAQHNQEHPNTPVTVRAFSRPFHDRFLVIDDDLWHCGASFKDLGRKLFAIDKMGIDKNMILNQL